MNVDGNSSGFSCKVLVINLSGGAVSEDFSVSFLKLVQELSCTLCEQVKYSC